MKKLRYRHYLKQAKFYKDGDLINEYFADPRLEAPSLQMLEFDHESYPLHGIVPGTYFQPPVFIMTPGIAFAILKHGVYDRVDILLTETNAAYYEGEGSPGSVTGWVTLNECEDGGVWEKMTFHGCPMSIPATERLFLTGETLKSLMSISSPCESCKERSQGWSGNPHPPCRG